MIGNHPDPIFCREEWLSLDGTWEFQPDPNDLGARQHWTTLPRFSSCIQVPYPVESDAAGLAEKTNARVFWYARNVEIPESWEGRDVFLHIGAADQDCEVMVNGTLIASHEGGYTPLACSITRALRGGGNRIVIRVRESRKASLPRGKQTNLPFRHTIFYRPYSGIWQSVWLEVRGVGHLDRAAGLPLADLSGFDFQVSIRGISGDLVRIVLMDDQGREDSVHEAVVDGREMNLRVIPRSRMLWSPDSPRLYKVRYELLQGDEVIDKVWGYAALRTVKIQGRSILLNDEPLYQKLVLYQPYYPGGWSTPVSDQVLQEDVKLVKSFGFNGIRIHQSLAVPRLLYWCDRLGLLAWGEMPSPFILARVDKGAFEKLLREAVARDLGHPSIITWVLFNESWGILDLGFSRETREWVAEMKDLCRALDPSRPVIDNSGYEHITTDILDIHHYLADPAAVEALYKALEDPTSLTYKAWRNLYMVLPSKVFKSPLAPGSEYQGQPVIISECGGHGFGPYSKSGTLEESMLSVLGAIGRHPHIRGFCYTQLFDVEQECNGLAGFDRRPKLDPAVVKQILDGIRGSEL